MNTFGCGEVRDRLPARQDRELAPKEAAAVDAHLASCADCRQEERALSSAWMAFRRAHDAPRVPPALAANPFSPREAPLFDRLSLRGGLAAAFACAALAIAVWPRSCKDAARTWSPEVEIAAFRDLGSAELVLAREPSPEPVLEFK